MSKKIMKAIENHLVRNNKDCSLSLLGSPNRRNSWTYKRDYPNASSEVIKVLKPRIVKSKEIENEEKALSKLKNETNINVVSYLDKGALNVLNNKYKYFIFPYINGNDLESLVNRNNNFPEKEVLSFLKSITNTIIQLGSLGIVHQDIKPANIIKNLDSDYILIDLGIAVFIDHNFKKDLKQQGPAIYLSPEQVELGQKRSPKNQRKISFLSDIYSSGVVALRLLLGDNFFNFYKADERHKVIDRIIKNKIKIANNELKMMLISYLDENIIKRYMYIKKYFKREISFLENKVENIKPYWHLHQLATGGGGNSLIKNFLADNTTIKNGIVFLSENITKNTPILINQLKKRNWDIIIDPSTFKFQYNEIHHPNRLKERPYYISDFSYLIEPDDIKSYVKNVIEYQKSLNPSFFIHPYLFIKDESSLNWNFSLYEETVKQFPEINEKLFFGIALREDTFCNENELNNLLDQLIVYKEANKLYLKVELLKTKNSPCRNTKYLQGLMKFLDLLSDLKTIFLSNVDQSCLGLLVKSNFSFSINPNVSYRKLDIHNKHNLDEKKEVKIKKEDRHLRIYIPALLNDLELTRDLKDIKEKNPKIFSKLNCNCKYCNSSIDSMVDNNKRNLHFMLNFNNQLHTLISSNNRVNKFTLILSGAKKIYNEISSSNIKITTQGDGNFLEVWENVFLNTE